jgi:hypothetical protein
MSTKPTPRQRSAVRRCVEICDRAGFSAMTRGRLSPSVIRACVARGWLMRIDGPVFAEDDSECERPRVGYVATEAGRQAVRRRG